MNEIITKTLSGNGRGDGGERRERGGIISRILIRYVSSSIGSDA